MFQKVPILCSYPASYQLADPRIEATKLHVIWPELDISHVTKMPPASVPEGWDGIGVFPKPSVLAEMSEAPKEWPIINRAMVHLVGRLYGDRPTLRYGGPDGLQKNNPPSPFLDRFTYEGDGLGPQALRIFESGREGILPTPKAHNLLESGTPGDVLVFPMQSGIAHSGVDPRDVPYGVETRYRPWEFGLHPFFIGCLLLLHPERLSAVGDLWINCPGARYGALAENERLPHQIKWHFREADRSLNPEGQEPPSALLSAWNAMPESTRPATLTVSHHMPVPYWDVVDYGPPHGLQRALNRYWVGDYALSSMRAGCATGLLPEYCRP